MKNLVFTTFVSIFFFTTNAYAETYCENINKTGIVVNSPQLAEAMNRWLVQKGVSYQTSPQEMTKTIMNFCVKNPRADSNDATNHLNQIVDALAALK